jgi:hypothetical protein
MYNFTYIGSHLHDCVVALQNIDNQLQDYTLALWNTDNQLQH